MRRTKKSVSALIVALCMLVQLIPAFPVQMAEAADGDIVISFDHGNPDLGLSTESIKKGFSKSGIY